MSEQVDPASEGSVAPAGSLKEQILAIGRRCAGLPDRDMRKADEILGYDDDGLPR